MSYIVYTHAIHGLNAVNAYIIFFTHMRSLYVNVPISRAPRFSVTTYRLTWSGDGDVEYIFQTVYIVHSFYITTHSFNKNPYHIR